MIDAELLSNIPTELALERCWIAYKLMPPDEKGKINKIPLNPTSNPNDPTSVNYNSPEVWMSLKGVLTFVNATKNPAVGVGFFFDTTTPYVGIDFDHCLNEQGDILDDRVTHWVKELDSYTEVSVSGTGLHVIVKAEHPKGIRRAWAEIYPHGRFFAITGDTLPGAPEDIRERTDQVKALAAVLTGLSSGSTPPWPGQEVTETPATATREQMLEALKQFWVIDDVVLSRMTTGRSKLEIAELMEGDTSLWKGEKSPYPSRSEADAALMLYLADYTNCNKEQMLRLFKKSGLDRTDEKPETYYDITMESAITVVISRTRPEISSLESHHINFLMNQQIDDGGHARCLEYLYGDRFLNVVGAGWMQRGETHWSVDLAESLLAQTAEAMLRLRQSIADRNKNDKLERASAVQTSRIRAVEYMFSAYTAVNITDMDKDPYLLNVRNGIIDLRTGELISRTPSDRFSYCIPVPYIPDATCELWEKTLFENMDENREVYDFVQRAVGYSFTGNTREEKMFYIYGPARSGKGVFTQTLQTMMGAPLFTQIDFGVLTGSRGDDRQNFALAPLKPARFVSASESSKYEKLNEAVIKTATGRDPISAAFKYQTPFNFIPQFKVWLSSNHPPTGDVDDDAFWGRIATINFPRTHLGSENVMLKETLEIPESLMGILNWAVKGAVMWNQQGLRIPGVVAATTSGHRDDQDIIKQWLDAECLLKQDELCPFEDLYASYKAWCARNGVTPSMQRAFVKGLASKGLGERQMKYTYSHTDLSKKPRQCVKGVSIANEGWLRLRQAA